MERSTQETRGRCAVSVVIPAKNESLSLQTLLPKLKRSLNDAEIIVVDDGSADSTGEVAKRFGARVIRHPYSMGNGAAVKTGISAASGEVLVLLDADSQHDPSDIARLLEELDKGFDMVVGARSPASHAGIGRRLANGFYNALASYMTGHEIKDLTSGFRVARASKLKEFVYLLPNGFSYPTTSTMAFFRAGYPVAYAPIDARKRIGSSHIRPLHDGIRFLLIIFKIGTLYSPLKLFLPVSMLFFLTGLGYYLYTFFTAGRFTNMSALMFTTAVLSFLIGLVSEQITQLIYQPRAAVPGRDAAIEQEQRLRGTGT